MGQIVCKQVAGLGMLVHTSAVCPVSSLNLISTYCPGEGLPVLHEHVSVGSQYSNQSHPICVSEMAATGETRAYACFVGDHKLASQDV